MRGTKELEGESGRPTAELGPEEARALAAQCLSSENLTALHQLLRHPELEAETLETIAADPRIDRTAVEQIQIHPHTTLRARTAAAHTQPQVRSRTQHSVREELGGEVAEVITTWRGDQALLGEHVEKLSQSSESTREIYSVLMSEAPERAEANLEAAENLAEEPGRD